MFMLLMYWGHRPRGVCPRGHWLHVSSTQYLENLVRINSNLNQHCWHLQISLQYLSVNMKIITVFSHKQNLVITSSIV